MADLREALAGELAAARISTADLTELAARTPAIAHVLLDLGRRNHHLTDRLVGATDGRGTDPETPGSPHEEIRDCFYRRQHYLHETDRAAERLAAQIGIRPSDVLRVLAARLADRHGIRLSTDADDLLHHYDGRTRTLHLSTRLRPGQRACHMATQLALLEHGDHLDDRAAEDFPPDSPAPALAHLGVANYCAAALVLPYTDLVATAEHVRYDIERLTDRYSLGYETVCHRLSTRQRLACAACPSPSSAWTAPATCPGDSPRPASLLPRGRHLPALERLRGVHRPRPEPRPARRNARGPTLLVDSPGPHPTPRRLVANRARPSPSAPSFRIR